MKKCRSLFVHRCINTIILLHQNYKISTRIILLMLESLTVQPFWLILSLVIIPLLGYFYYQIHGYYYKGQKKNLKGKYAIITGGNAGLGKQTLRQLAQCECTIIIGARDKNKSLKVIKQIISETKNKNIQYIPLDLSSRSSIESFVKCVQFDRIDYLINNAGVFGIPKLCLTEMGFEMHEGINYQGHFYLTYLLWDKLQRSEYFRIINVSSRVHKYFAMYFWQTSLDLNNIHFQNGGYGAHIAYARSKLYNVMFTKALSERIDPNRGVAVSLHPGSVRTQIIRQFPLFIQFLIKIAHPLYCFMLKSQKQGVQTTLYCIFSQQIIPGGYYEDCREGIMNKSVTKENWDKLWKKSEQEWKIKF